MKLIAIAIASSGLLAAPAVMANCDRELDRIEARVQNSNAPQQQKTNLLEWVEEQRSAHRDATSAQCTQLAAEMDRQVSDRLAAAQDRSGQPVAGMSQSGTDASGTQATTASTQATTTATQQPLDQPQTLGATAQTGQDRDRADIAVQAPPAQVSVQQPPPSVDVQQQSAQVDVHLDPPSVVVEVPESEVQVTQREPRVSVTQSEPQVTVIQGEPEVSLHQPDPIVSVQQAEPQVEVRTTDPTVNVHEQDAVVSVQPSQPLTDTQGTAAVADPAAPGMHGSRPLSQEQVTAAELQGQSVVNIQGHVIGEVAEVLRERDSNQMFVRVQVDPSVDLSARQLMLEVNDLERNADNLLVRSNLDELEQAGSFAEQRFEPAEGETLQLAAPTDD
jgi:hypothetical protein